MKITKNKRTFIKEDLIIDSWEKIKPYFEELLSRKITDLVGFKKWLADRSELDAVLEEDAAWRYIKMTIDTRNQALKEAYTFFITKIQPELAPYEDKLNQKMVDSPYFSELNSDHAYQIYFRSVKTALDLFREKNIPLEAELGEKSQQYGSISAAQTIEHNGETLTMQRAASFLKETDETLRKTIFEKIVLRRKEDISKLNDLYTELIRIRHEVALNTGFANYRDYKFLSLNRFDYTKEDCFAFHAAIRKHIVPLVKQIQQEKLNKLGKEKFRPWDTEVDPEGKAPLKPFEKGSDLLKGTVQIFEKIDTYFADCLRTMDEMGHLDLDSKEGKAPGGYNYPLYEIGVPFIFMNAVGAQRDLVTIVHEGGHAVHSFLSRDLELTGFKNLPSEVAELASMSMELLTMEHWDEFYSNEDDFKRAKKEQLESILKILPWIAQIDEFQHWIYEYPTHSHEERSQKWIELSKSYGTGLTDWTGFEEVQATAWQRQLHLFEVPFYYIEYGIAQLGALGVWKNSLNDKKSAIENYKNALRLGYTQSIPNIYKTAGIRFDFSDTYLSELAGFVAKKLACI
jgi:oligoendopeptidase F